MPGKEAVVCILHFEDHVIVKEDKIAYLSKPRVIKRKSPDARRKSIIENDEKKFKMWLKNDEITSFEDLKSSVNDKLDSS